jgi:hypothetical protein
MQGNDGIVGFAGRQGYLNHLEQCLGLGNAVNDHRSGEVTMLGMFRMGLSHVKTFDIYGIPTQFFLE